MSDYTFSLGYLNELDVFNSGYGISITALQSDSAKIGDVLQFNVVYFVDDALVPVGASPTTTIEWINHNGDVLGSGSTLTYEPTEDGYYSIQATVTIEDIAWPFLLEMTDGHSFYVAPLNGVDYVFKAPFEADHGKLIYSNMDIFRFLTYFPKWSSVYNSHYTNTSKLISPALERLSFMMSGIDEVMANDNSNTDHIPFGYKDYTRSILTITKPDFINTEYGFCANLGESSSMSLDSIPIGAIHKNLVSPIVKVRETMYAGDIRIRFPRPSVAYIYSERGSLESVEEVVVTGVNKLGQFINELVVIDSSVPIETVNEFMLITRISGNTGEIEISNYIDDRISWTERSTMGKRIVSHSGVYFNPRFDVTGTSLFISNGDKFSKNEEFKFSLPFEPDKILISNLLDVIVLKDQSLYSSKLMLDYYDLDSPGSSVNHNSFIWVDDENTAIGSSARLTINTDLIKKDSNATSIRISIRNGDAYEYLSEEGTLVASSDTWIRLSKAGNRISFDIPIQNDLPYICSLEDNSRIFPLYAMVYQNKIHLSKIDENITDMFIHNRELYVIDTLSDTYHSDAVRLGFITGEDRSYVQFPFETMELLYAS